VVLGVELDKGDDLSAVLDQFEVLIDFTRPEATLDYLATCLSANKAMVIGTTGFDDAGLSIINNAAQKMPVVFAPNMSVGVNLSFKLLEMAKSISSSN
jgi:4-hydroxy-tetrahydrodipicolinate reductase